MTRTYVGFVAVMSLISVAGRAFACDEPTKPIPQDEQVFQAYRKIYEDAWPKSLARIYESLIDLDIDSKGIEDKELTLAEYLAALEAKTKGKNHISIRVDSAGLGKDADRIAATKFRIRVLPPQAVPLSYLQTTLKYASNEIGKEVDYAIRPEGIFITWPRLTAYRATYNLTKVFGATWPSDSDLRFFSQPPGQNKDLEDSKALLAHALLTSIPLRPWESVELVNGTKLIVDAGPDRHLQFADVLDQLWKLADIYIIMNARLIEIDKALYEKQVAPLFIGANGREMREVILVNDSLFKMLAAQRPLITSDDSMLQQSRESVFLSRQRPFRFTPADSDSETPQHFGIEGVSMSVRPLTTPDRRFIWMRITQRVERLMGSKRIAKDPIRGSVKIEIPDIRATSSSATLQIPDGATILMRADLPPEGELDKDKVRLVLACPYIWIPREMAERGVSKVSDYSESIWKSAPAHETADQMKPEAAPSTDTTREILQAVVHDVLKNPELKKLRDFYGTMADKRFALADGNSLAWPKEFKPDIPSFELVASKPDPFANRPHVLGIRISSIDKNLSETELNDSAVTVQLFNAGGSANGIVCGNSDVNYSVQRIGKRWTVKLEWAGVAPLQNVWRD